MNILIIFLTLLLSPTLIQAQNNSLPAEKIRRTAICSLSKALKFEVISQRSGPPTHAALWGTIQVAIRLKNVSKCPVYIKSFNWTPPEPVRIALNFDNRKKRWLNPAGEASYPTFESLELTEWDNILLDPDRSLTWTDSLEDFPQIPGVRAVRRKYKELIYLSLDSSKAATRSVESPVITLSNTK